MNNVVIKNATPTDWQTVQKLNAEVFENDMNHDEYLNSNWPFTTEGEAYYQTICTEKNSHFTIITYIENIPVGYLTASQKECDYRTNKPFEINNIGVSPNYRSKGIGKKMLDHVKAWAKENGYTHVFVNAYAKNTKVHAFYQKMGLQPIDISFEGTI